MAERLTNDAYTAPGFDEGGLYTDYVFGRPDNVLTNYVTDPLQVAGRSRGGDVSVSSPGLGVDASGLDALPPAPPEGPYAF